MTSPPGYPEHLAGAPAPSPEHLEGRVLAMALKSHARHLERLDGLRGAGKYRRAYALDQLVAEVDAIAPDRNRASDGWIGDERHQGENGPNGPGSGSDHNPWVRLGDLGIVRAQDITNDPVLRLAEVFERMRVAVLAGQLPQLDGGGYLILAGRITAPDWSGWRVYSGDPHVSHGHVSVSLAAGHFDDRRRWGVFGTEHPPAPPAPAPAPVVRDLTGRGDALRGDVGDTGPRVGAVQAFLRRYAPAYAGQLAVDGVWGPRTTAALAEFAHRSGIPEADGRNIGPRIAAALHRAGFDTSAAARPERAPAPPPEPPASRSSARDRVRGHIDRRGRR